MLQGMSYLESRGIVHRDLAARNVLGSCFVSFPQVNLASHISQVVYVSRTLLLARQPAVIHDLLSIPKMNNKMKRSYSDRLYLWVFMCLRVITQRELKLGSQILVHMMYSGTLWLRHLRSRKSMVKLTGCAWVTTLSECLRQCLFVLVSWGGLKSWPRKSCISELYLRRVTYGYRIASWNDNWWRLAIVMYIVIVI